MKNYRPKVYVAMAVDFLHEGHLNILNKASNLGEVTIGLLTDAAISSYKKFPNLSYENRKKLIKNLKFVKNIIPQNTLDYEENLIKLKPDYVVHGDDWKVGVQKIIRKKVIKVLKKWSGKLIEIKYSKDISLQDVKKKIFDINNNPINRINKLKRLIEVKDLVRILECHNPLSGLVVENTFVKKNNLLLEYDAMWSSSLTDSVSRAKPDNQSVDYSTRIQGVSAILSATTKPLLFDIDNGGHVEHLKYIIKDLERAGVSGIVIEDKIGLKKNSLFDDQTHVKQDSISNFSKKLKVAKSAVTNKDFLIIARIESLILGKTVGDAINRAINYSKAGADCIMIHSKAQEPKKIFEFSKKFRKTKYFKPLVAVPSTYSKTYERQLKSNGFQIVIYANHLLRAAYLNMHKTALNILKYNRSFESEKFISSIKDILNLIKND
jgi:phosphoenolpyruvate phosphomutase